MHASAMNTRSLCRGWTWITLDLAAPATIIVGENSTGKSTFIEAVAAICGFGKGYRPVQGPPRPDVAARALYLAAAASRSVAKKRKLSRG